MKKILSLMLSLACLCGLTACQEEAKPATPPEHKISAVQAMVDAGAFSEELAELDGDTAFALYQLGSYGLVREDLLECAVLRSSGATCEEGAVLLFSDEEKSSLAETALKDYIQSQIRSNTDYRPAEIPKLEAALISRQGSSLLLVVANDMEAAKRAVN